MFKHRDRAIKGVDWIEPQDIIGNIKVGMGFKKKKEKEATTFSLEAIWLFFEARF